MKCREMLVSAVGVVLGLSAFASSCIAAEGKQGGKTYYVDPAAGDDANDGLAPSRPLKTYATREFAGGDTVLFKRGSVVRDVLYTRSGAEQRPITYGAYGEGDRPAFLGSVRTGGADQWVEERPSVWRYTGTFSSEVCNLIFNDGESCGILRWRMEDVRRPGEWHYTGIGRSSSGGAGQDHRDGVLYLCSPVNPGRAYDSIECALWGQRKLVGGEHDLVLENLCFRNAGVHGYQEYHTRNVVIRNCEFRHIGGAVWSLKHRIRFGNAVELWDGASNITVEGCVFDNIYDSGVTHQGGGTRNIPERIHFRDNLFVGCGLAAYECREPSREVYFEYNTCIDGGGGFSMQGEVPPRRSDPYPQPVGYHVFIWMIDAGTQPGNVYVRHNIFRESHGAAISAIIAPGDERQFVIDHNAYWQTTDNLLIQFVRLTEGKTWAEALASMTARGQLPIHRSGRLYRPSQFSHYQAACGQDKHSLVSRALFVDEAGGDYRQREGSPCPDMGMRIDVRRDVRPQRKTASKRISTPTKTPTSTGRDR
ncbi:MAG: right-handed parallel beta-helix repeat-containing protein [Phycisphaerae bacterium]|nr:right-handed parallel beta-helix repeat-containing protein [Phycisphaerae bacterium]